MSRTYQAVMEFLREEDGPTAVEYAVMAALIGAFCVSSVAALALAAETNFNDTAAAMGN